MSDWSFFRELVFAVAAGSAIGYLYLLIASLRIRNGLMWRAFQVLVGAGCARSLAWVFAVIVAPTNSYYQHLATEWIPTIVFLVAQVLASVASWVMAIRMHKDYTAERTARRNKQRKQRGTQ